MPRLAEKQVLDDRKVAALPPSTATNARGQLVPYIVWDGVLPNFGVRVSPTGAKTWVVQCRIKGQPTNKKIGKRYPQTTLKQAREEARGLMERLTNGDYLAPDSSEPSAARPVTLNDLYEDFERRAILRIGKPGGPLRKADATIGNFKRDILPVLGDLALTEIKWRHVRDMLDAHVDRGHHTTAHMLFSCVRALLNFGVERGEIEINICWHKHPSSDAVIGPLVERTRVLSEAEIRALWTASASLEYGPLWKMLLLTGLRRRECAGIRWDEISLDDLTLTVSGARMKLTRDRRLRPHVVPLTEPMLGIIAGQNEFECGPHVFSSSFGLNPWCNFHEHKILLDNRMRELLGGELAPYVTHDLRRTVRTRLEAMPGVPYVVAERILAHNKSGPYRQHDYLLEKRSALELWSAEVTQIVNGGVHGLQVQEQEDAA
jgi:integrase